MYKQETWSVYEANVQAYRSNFLSSQSLLLAAGAIMFDKNNYIFVAIAVVALFQMWYIWFRIIMARIYIVDFHKFALYEHFDRQGNLIEGESDNSMRLGEKDYASDGALRKKVNQAIPLSGKFAGYSSEKRFTNLRLTRKKLDILLPVSLTAVWAAFIVVLLAECL